MNPRETTRAIQKKFHVHSGDNLPYEGWIHFTRDDLIALFGELGFKTGAEIGVRTGRNSETMFKLIPGLKLYCVDPWGAYLRVTDERQEGYYRQAKKRLAPYGENASLMKMTSMEAVKLVPDNSLDFVYLDGRHDFDFVIADIINWVPKVKTGGIISGHDLYFFYDGGVIGAVEAYTMANDVKAWYVTREPAPSWFWVKE